jgi:hypothetical protein
MPRQLFKQDADHQVVVWPNIGALQFRNITISCWSARRFLLSPAAPPPTPGCQGITIGSRGLGCDDVEKVDTKNWMRSPH